MTEQQARARSLARVLWAMEKVTEMSIADAPPEQVMAVFQALLAGVYELTDEICDTEVDTE